MNAFSMANKSATLAGYLGRLSVTIESPPKIILVCGDKEELNNIIWVPDLGIAFYATYYNYNISTDAHAGYNSSTIISVSNTTLVYSNSMWKNSSVVLANLTLSISGNTITETTPGSEYSYPSNGPWVFIYY